MGKWDWNDNPFTRTAERTYDQILDDPLSAAIGIGGGVAGIQGVAASTTQPVQDVARDIPVIGDMAGLESSADIAAGEQNAALTDAQRYQEEMYKEAKGQLTPYADYGKLGLEELAVGTVSGAFDPGAFNYGGQQVGAMDYKRAPGAMSYQGMPMGQTQYQGQPMGELGYQGGPSGRSIASFMGDISQDPGYQFQLAEGQKAIDRASAGTGRWGGGATAKGLQRFSQGLASQEYGNAFNRANMERGVQQGFEQEQYGRGLTQFDMARQAEQERYGRDFAGGQLDRQAEQEAYGRDLTGYNQNLMRNQTDYDRSRAQYSDKVSQEQQAFDRSLQNFNINASRMTDHYNRLGALTGIGQQASGAIANAAIGQGSNLSDIAIQRGNVAASATMAGSNQLGQLLELGGQIAPMVP